jgi:hypothetical protein
VLSLVSVGLLVFEAVAELRPHQAMLLERVDLVIAFIFLGDFTWRFYRAENRRRFFVTSWWELLAAIPLTNETTRALRGIRDVPRSRWNADERKHHLARRTRGLS